MSKTRNQRRQDRRRLFLYAVACTLAALILLTIQTA